MKWWSQACGIGSIWHPSSPSSRCLDPQKLKSWSSWVAMPGYWKQITWSRCHCMLFGPPRIACQLRNKMAMDVGWCSCDEAAGIDFSHQIKMNAKSQSKEHLILPNALLLLVQCGISGQPPPLHWNIGFNLAWWNAVIAILLTSLLMSCNWNERAANWKLQGSFQVKEISHVLETMVRNCPYLLRQSPPDASIK